MKSRNWIVASCQSNGQHGLQKLSLELEKLSFTGTHADRIWDLKLCPTDDLTALTVGKDGFIKLTDVSNGICMARFVKNPSKPEPTNPACLCSIQLNEQVWSCTWERSNPNLFYAGLNGGDIVLYDKRNTSRSMLRITGHHPSPVYDIASVPWHKDSTDKLGSLLLFRDYCI